MKKLTPIFYGTIEKGTFKLDNQDRFKKYLSSLKGRVQLTVRPARKKRSSQQNKFYWGVVIKLIAEELGYDSDELHEALKWKFLKVNNPKLPTVRSTAKLSTVEFMDYIDQIVRFASQELNIIIPDASEVDYESLEDWG